MGRSGGIDEDFGIKFNCENGGPAPEKVTEKIFEITKTITEYKICKGFPTIDLANKGTYVVDGKIRVDVFDCAEDHIGLLMKVFDFEAIKKLIARKDFSPVLMLFMLPLSKSDLKRSLVKSVVAGCRFNGK